MKTRLQKIIESSILVLLLSVVAWFFLPDSWTDPLKYSMEYSINLDQVHWNDKPTDCDFMHAPLGIKGCHYKKTVTARNAAGYSVAGNDAPVYGNDTNTGKPIISHDRGKNWAWLADDAPKLPDLKVKWVDIEWIKVTD